MIMRVVLSILVAILFTHTALAGDFEDGVDAYGRQDYATALAKFRTAAERGNAKAQTSLGWMYRKGHGVAQDYTEAVRWYQLAAQQGEANAQFNLGGMYDLGQGVAQDDKEAVRWYQLAAKQGYADAQNSLGLMFGDGQGVAQDYVRAHMWLSIGAVGGDSRSAKNRDIMARKMTPQQIAEAQRMARECQARNFKNCD
jgi:TPR repeat protein